MATCRTMANRTLTHLTDSELLNLIDSKRQYSSIIDELCKRIENLELDIPDTINSNVQCPICACSLKISLKETNDSFHVEINK